MGVTVTTPAAAQPLTRQETKLHLRVTSTDEDGWIDDSIKAARAYVETYLDRRLINTVLSWQFRSFPSSVCPLYVPEPPLVSVSSIQYTDADGNNQTWTSSLYDVDTSSQPGRIEPAYGEDYPQTRDDPNAVTVAYTAGFGTAHTDVPQEIRQAMKLLIGHWYVNREGVLTGKVSKEIEFSVSALLGPWQILSIR